MVHNLLDPRGTGSSACAKGRQSVLVTLNVKLHKMGGESGGDSYDKAKTKGYGILLGNVRELLVKRC